MSPRRSQPVRTRACIVRLALLSMVAAGATRAQARVPAAAPPRPALTPSADTNDAGAYYTYGSILMSKDPGAAYDGFYWASRLEPSMAEAYYARAMAINLAWIALVIDKIEVDPGYELTPPQELALRFDTLMIKALTSDPFFDRRFDLLLFPRRVRAAIGRSRDPYFQGYYAYAMHEFGAAADAWAKALRKDPNNISLHIQRAQALYHANERDSAYAELALVADTIEARQQQKLSREYESKEMLRYAMGIIRVEQKRFDAARELFGQALSENLALYMAHVRLAGVDLVVADTAGALNEFALAVQIAGTDPVLRLQYARLLHAVARDEEAVAQLGVAIELDPYYTAPYELLGQVHDAHGRTAEATRAYREFVRRAAKRDPSLPRVRHRLAALQADSAAAPGGPAVPH